MVKIQGIDNPENKEKIAIVAIGYNRVSGLLRLLQSLEAAEYDIKDVPLVISIDYSGCEDVYYLASNFKWSHGEKYVNIQEVRLGLKDHIFQCFSLSTFFKGVIILEDDLFVSTYFYHYCLETLHKYGEDENVAGIALYSNEYNGFHGVPIQILNNGYDVFARQAVCSWGEMLNERMWKNLSDWMEHFDGNFTSFDMNEDIKTWSRAWSKFMYAYMLQTDSSFIYPVNSLTTNFNDDGGEHGGGGNKVQVSLLQGKRMYALGDYRQLVHYDVYGDNMDIHKWLGLSKKELSVDVLGSRNKYYGRYVLSTFNLPYKKVKGFQLSMRPWELNIKYSIAGNDIILYDRESNEPVKAPIRKYPYQQIMYYLGRYMPRITPSVVFTYYWQYYFPIIKNKLMFWK